MDYKIGNLDGFSGITFSSPQPIMINDMIEINHRRIRVISLTYVLENTSRYEKKIHHIRLGVALT